MRAAWTLSVVMLAGACTAVGIEGEHAGSAAPTAAEPRPEPYVAARGDVVDRYHGYAVADPYRWLEGDGPAVQRWVDAQDRHAREGLARLSDLSAHQEAIERVARARRVMVPQPAGARRVFIEADGAFTETTVMVEHEGRARRLIEGHDLVCEGVRLAGLWPSPDGAYLAYGRSRLGTRDMTLHVLDIDTGRAVMPPIEGLITGRSSVSWLDGGRVLAYTRYDAQPGQPEGSLGVPYIVTCTVGGAVQERGVVDFGEAEIVRHWARKGADEELIVVVRGTDGASRIQRVLTATTTPRVLGLAPSAPGTYEYIGEANGAMAFVTTVGAERGRVIVARIDERERPRWSTLVAESAEAIDTWIGVGSMATVVGERVLVVYRRDARWIIRIYRIRIDEHHGDPRGQEERTVVLPSGASMWSGLVPDERAGVVFVRLTGFADPGTVVRLDPTDGSLQRWRGEGLPYDPDAYVTEIVDYPRAGHDPAPMFLAHRRDLEPDAERPVLVYGYGWGGWSAAPWLRPHAQAFMDAGGMLALPILRGGGERGEAWHQAGVRRQRENAIADYLSACEWLAESRWSRAGRLVAEGQSAGGSLVAMAVLRRPDLFGAQILAFPVLDMLRYARFSGARAWIPEFGTVDDPEDFAVLRATSPLHNVTRGTCPPPTLLLPGELDPITPPLHAYKYAATLQHARDCEAPVWLRVARQTEHAYGRDSTETAASLAAQVAFAIHYAGR